MALTRVVVSMRKGDPHIVDFSDEAAARSALQEVHEALEPRAKRDKPVTIAGRLVVVPEDIRSAALEEPPSFGLA
jgi:hypothetical protein